MTTIELLKMNKSLIALMGKNNIKVKDVDMLDIILEADDMSAHGEQKCYIVQTLAEKYGVSVRSIYYAMDKFKQNVVF